MKFYAHSDPTGLREDNPAAQWQLLNEHLSNVGLLARRLATLASPSDSHFHDLAEWSGLLHDFGKYSDCFQQMIREGKGKCQHAIHGAAIAYDQPLQGLLGLRAPHVAHAIAGHHAGIPDRTVGLHEKVKQFVSEARSLRDRAMRDSPDLARLLRSPSPDLQSLGERFDLSTRILLSCLVDADRLDTAGRHLIQAPLDAALRFETLQHYIEKIAQGRTGVVATARRDVLEDCIAAAHYPEQLLSLSVPTGGGKTLSAMAFALKRAALNPQSYRRIIRCV